MSEAAIERARAEALLKAGDLDGAGALIDRLLDADPDDAKALVLRVNLANLRGNLGLLIGSLQQLHARFPLHSKFAHALATALNNRGARSRERGDARSACDDLTKALDLQPEHPQAWFNLGLCLRGLGQDAAAIEAFDRHLGIAGEDPVAVLLRAALQGGDAAAQAFARQLAEPVAGLDPGWLAHTAARAGQADATIEALQRLQAGHDHVAALDALIELHLRTEIEAIAESAPLVIRAAKSAGRSTLRAELIQSLSVLPAIGRDQAHLAEQRACFIRGLELLEQRWTPAHLRAAQPGLGQVQHSNFLLAYQGEDDTALQRRYAALIERAVACLRPELTEAAEAHGRRRVGLLSSCWRTCTVGSYFGCWVAWLAEAGYEVFLYQWGPQRDALTEQLAGVASHFRFLQGSIEETAAQIRLDGLHLLIYPELGMDARLLPLAAMRLAARQAVGWGHPVTTGFAAIDVFLSCALMEPEHAERHYNERLLALPNLGVDYRRPPQPEFTTVESLGLDPSRPRVLVPQSLFKLHPDGDPVMCEIARACPRVQLVFFSGERPSWHAAFRTRLTSEFSRHGLDFERHAVVLPLGTRARFLQVNRACDLMLDSLHWSGGNTALDALQCGLPLVTVRGAFMRGRQSAAMLQMLGLAQDLICASPAAQAERVLALLDSPDERHGLSVRISESLEKLFDPAAARLAFLAWAEQECGQPPR